MKAEATLVYPVRTIVVIVAGLIGFSAPLAAGQDYRYGMNARAVTPAAADKMVELGAGTIRVVFGWDVIEPGCKGCFNWSFPDAWRDEARRTKRALFVTLAYTPQWANGGHPYNYPPQHIQ